MKPIRKLSELSYAQLLGFAVGISCVGAGVILLGWPWGVVAVGVFATVVGKEAGRRLVQLIGVALVTIGLAFAVPALALIFGGFLLIGVAGYD